MARHLQFASLNDLPLRSAKMQRGQESRSFRNSSTTARKGKPRLKMRTTLDALKNSEISGAGRAHRSEYRRHRSDRTKYAVVHEQKFVSRAPACQREWHQILPGTEIQAAIPPMHDQCGFMPCLLPGLFRENGAI
jgi:hypothetical protein